MSLSDDGGLVAFLIRLGFDVHRLGFGLAFLQDDLGFRFALGADRRRRCLRLP